MLTLRPQSSSRRGFTLIELLAVLMIIAILTYFLVTNMSGGIGVVNEGVVKNRMGTLRAMLSQVADEKGDFPRSQLPNELGTAPNALNVGAECLYLALCAQGAPGVGTLDKPEDLCNTDGDSLGKRAPGFETQELFELADGWGNPLVYIHHLDYEREFRYVAVDGESGEAAEYNVRAFKNAKTGRFEEPNGFQLISAGSDGQFGTADDIVNSQIKK